MIPYCWCPRLVSKSHDSSDIAFFVLNFMCLSDLCVVEGFLAIVAAWVALGSVRPPRVTFWTDGPSP